MSKHLILLGGVLVVFTGVGGQAREFLPHIGYVYPAGGRQGTTVQVTFGGQYLVEPTAAHVSGHGVQAVVQPSEPLLTGKEAADVRGELQELRQKRDAASRHRIRALSHRLAVYERSKITPAIGEKVAVQITIAPDAAPGNREVRLATATGLTNPLLFQIGQLPECREPESEGEEAWTNIQRTINDPDGRARPGRNDAPPMLVTLPTTINGQILAGEVDRYRFHARRGQKLVAAVSGRELIPYIGDAVPGWLQAIIALYDPEGRNLAAVDDIGIGPDPVRRYEIPESGEYVLEIRDSLHRGREDFVYRIRVGDLPWITGIFPLGVREGTQTTVQLEGWNLPDQTQVLDSRGMAPGIHRLFVRTGSGLLSNSMPFRIDSLPETVEREPNDTPQQAQSVTLPVVINGRMDHPGDLDIFRFEGRAGELVVAEVHARRLDSPLDSVLIITDAAGHRIGFNDDHEDRGSGLNTHHADSHLAVTLPATGAYYVHLADTQQGGGTAYGYRLRISPPQPDFALRIVPSSINLRANATQAMTVHALRRDGFTGEIELALKDAPPGFLLSGARVPAHQDRVRITLTAPAGATDAPVGLLLVGRAIIDGETFVRSAVPAREMTQAFSHRHLVPSYDLLAHVTENHAPLSTARLLNGTPVRILPQGTTRVSFSLPRYRRFDAHRIRLVDPPTGITMDEFSFGRDRVEIQLKADASRLNPGVAGNLIFEFIAHDPTPPGSPRVNPKRIPLGTLPAVPYEVAGAGRGESTGRLQVPTTGSRP